METLAASRKAMMSCMIAELIDYVSFTEGEQSSSDELHNALP
jgi:hypothetical protein